MGEALSDKLTSPLVHMFIAVVTAMNQTKSHLCDIKGSFPVDGGPAPDDDEEHGADELGNQRSGEIPPTFRQQRVCRDHLESKSTFLGNAIVWGGRCVVARTKLFREH